ncbi:MAG: hypothetical protein ACRCZO_14270, partial [Cetobacterium sp.]
MDRKSKKREYDREWVSLKRLSKQQRKREDTELIMAAKGETEDTNTMEIMEKHEAHGIMKADDNENLNLETTEEEHNFEEHISEDSDVSEQFSDEDSLTMGDSNSNIARDIASWSTENGIAHNALDSLLKLLKKHGTKDLPSTSRTLLNTPKAVNIQQKSGMEYFFFGVEKMLKNHMQKHSVETTTRMQILELKLHIDGLPLFK